jgi:hypothetical protein
MEEKKDDRKLLVKQLSEKAYPSRPGTGKINGQRDT